jgi:hypothetical protein
MSSNSNSGNLSNNHSSELGSLSGKSMMMLFSRTALTSMSQSLVVRGERRTELIKAREK